MRYSLPALPTELVENVASHMEAKKDLLALRLVCTELCSKTTDVFTKAFYHTIEISLSLTSLYRLHHIAKHEYLRDKVKELHFVAKGRIVRGNLREQARYKNKLILSPTFGVGYEWREGGRREGGTGKFRWNCVAIRELCGLLTRSFTNCRSFRIGKDGTDWALLDGYRKNCITSFDVLAILLHIVGLTGMQVKSFTVESRLWASELATANPASHYDPAFWDFGRFQEGWNFLQSLDLDMMEHDLDPGMTSPEESAKQNARIVCAAKSLKRLRLAFTDHDGQSMLLQEISSGGFTPPLEILVLKSTEFSADAITCFLPRVARSLKTIVFHELGLHGRWESVFSLLQCRSRFSSLNDITMASLCHRVVQSNMNRYAGRLWLSFQYFRHNRLLPAPLENEKFELLDMPWSSSWPISGGLQGIRYKGTNMSVAFDLLNEKVEFIDYYRAGETEQGVLEKDFQIDEWRW